MILALTIGKVARVTSLGWLSVRLGWAELPDGMGWRHIVGAGLIGGVGFTVSLFITGLAFTDKVLVKFFLHLSKDEQRKRFLARIDDPDKNWKSSGADIKERALWEDYQVD